MHRALRPYVTTGVAIVGASVIAVAPIQPLPMDLHIPNPIAQLEPAVQLAANEIEDAINGLTFVGADVLVSLAKLPAPLVAELLGIPPAAAEDLLAIGALGLSGPLIGGAGGTGAALQDVVDQLGSLDLAGLLNALIGAPATVIGGVVNGEAGPNLSPLVGAVPDFLTLLAGGLINPGNLNPLAGPLIVSGLIPTLQGLITLLTSQLGSGDMMSARAAVVAEPPSQIEDAINSLVLLGTQLLVTLAQIPAPIVAPILGVSEEEAAGLLALGAVGLFGTLISGTGATGAAIQDVVNALGQGDIAGFLNALIGAPATVIDGAVNGGYGPNLVGLLGDFLPPAIPLPTPPFPPGSFAPVTEVLAGGLINGLPGVGITPTGLLNPLAVATITIPGLFPTLQGLVDRLLNPAPEPVPVESLSINSFETTKPSSGEELVVDAKDSQPLIDEEQQAKPKPKKRAFNPVGSTFRVVGGVLKAITPDRDNTDDEGTTDTNSDVSGGGDSGGDDGAGDDGAGDDGAGDDGGSDNGGGDGSAGS